MTITVLVTLEAASVTDLNTQVAAAILAGKQPFGPPFVHHLNANETRLCQAMITGSQILVGDTGAAGAAGTVVTFGAGAPSDASGANGDVYIRTSNGAFYKKAAGTWGAAQVTLTVT